MTDPSVAEFAFPGPIRDLLVAAILRGDKTTTTGLLMEYEILDETLPTVGARSLVVNSDGDPVAEIETTSVRLIRLADVDLDHAIAEGEGFRSVARWRAAHERFWRSEEMLAALGRSELTIDDDTTVVAEAFRLVRLVEGQG